MREKLLLAAVAIATAALFGDGLAPVNPEFSLPPTAPASGGFYLWDAIGTYTKIPTPYTSSSKEIS